MQSSASSPDEYAAALPEDRQVAIGKLRTIILKNLPEDFREEMSNGMIGYVIG